MSSEEKIGKSEYHKIYNRVKIECPICLCEYSQAGRRQHLRTKKHQSNYVKMLEKKRYEYYKNGT